MSEPDLAAALGRHAAAHSVPGAAIGVLRGGEAVTACHGVTDVRTAEPVTAATRFAIGSLTKSMVATVIGGLAHAGRLSLDDDVAGHVPELRGSGWAERATVRDLLANRSGLPLRAASEFGFDARAADADDGAVARLVADVAAGEPAGPFWSYSNVGWCVLGRVIEAVTGTTWEQAMRTMLVEPAGLRGTVLAAEPAPGRVYGHEVSTGGPVPVEPMAVPAYGPAGTSVVSTVTDMLRFAAWHLDDPSLAAMRAVHAEVPIYGWLDAWCLGWARFDWAGGPVWGWDGLVDGERSVLRIMPAQHAALVLLTNCGTGRAMYRSLLAEIMEPLFGIRAPALNLDPSPGAAGDLGRFAGTYAWPDRRIDVTAGADALLITSGGEQKAALPLNDRTFVVDAADPDTPTITFGYFDGAGRPGALYDMLWGLRRVDAGS
jgi:CubicO group peptidase (beta-lactamase class C family)